MGRMMPLDCLNCDGVIDWGDFGDDDAKPTCTCTPAPSPTLGFEIVTLLVSHGEHVRRLDEMAMNMVQDPSLLTLAEWWSYCAGETDVRP